MSTSTTNPDLAAVDLTDLGLWEEGPPHELFARMRAEAPVRWNPSADGEGFWSLTRGADIVEVSEDPATFSNAKGGIFLRPDAIGPLEFVRSLAIAKDPPEHTRFREVVAKTFRARTLTYMDEVIRDCVDTALDVAVEGGSCDLVRDVAEPVPLRVIGRMLGAAEDDMAELLAWTTEIERGIAYSLDVSETVMKMGAHLRGLVKNQSIFGVDSLAKTLMEAEIDGEPLTEEELALYFGLLLYAGNGPTRNAISSGVLALIEHPDQLRKIHDDPTRLLCTRSGRASAALNEILRWTTPVNYLARTATRDVTIGGVDIADGDRVVMWYASASRDPDFVPGADTFDIERLPRANPHFAFGGGGPHHCQGDFLAIKMLSVALTEIINRMPDLQLAQRPTRAATAFANQLTSMPVTFSRRSA